MNLLYSNYSATAGRVFAVGLFPRPLVENVSATIGVGSIGLAALVTRACGDGILRPESDGRAAV
jgi:hypothetical protein